MHPFSPPETLRFFDVFWGQRKGTLGTNGLSTTEIRPDKTLKIIKILDQSKVHENYNISVRILKICGLSIITPMFTIK